MTNIPKYLLESKIITDEQWEEYQIYKQSKEIILNKISIIKDKINNEYDIEEVIKGINDVFNYFKEDEVWQEYSKMYQLFMKKYNTCLISSKIGAEK